MHFKRIIPCLDVDAGRVVKGTNFVDIRDAGDPVELAARYDASGADELVFLDITATADKRDTVVELARRTADEVFIPFTIGGGIRSVADAQAVLDAGADKVSVNSAAVARPELVGELAERLGSQCVVLAIDAKRRPDGAPSGAEAGWEVFVAGGRTATGLDAVEWAAEGVARGAGEILLTSMDRDGTAAGYDLELVTRGGRGGGRARDRLRRGRRARAPGRRTGGRRRRRARGLDLPLRQPHGSRGAGLPARARGAAAPDLVGGLVRRPDLLDRARGLPGLAALPAEPPVHLVGGAVRDLLRGGLPRDLDLVVEGDPAALLAALRGEVAAHERFGTASVVVDGRRYDVVRARAESYPRPGSLPEVRPGSLAEDLARRDFTVNTFALDMADGELRWAGAAPDDLDARVLRVLHAGSFADDPTRLLRLARYAARLAFAVEPETRRLAEAAVAGGALSTVTPARIGTELILAAREPDPLAAFAALRDLGVDGAVAAGFGIDDGVHAGDALGFLPADGRRDVLVLAAAARRVADPTALVTRLALPAADARGVLAALAPVELAGRTAGEAGERLASLEGAALLAADGSEVARTWLERTRHVELEISGDDLRAAGVPEGPALGAALRAALRAKRDGQLTGGREAELAWVHDRLAR